jgi:predicted DsbA family dithiol-disulfide isomerase
MSDEKTAARPQVLVFYDYTCVFCYTERVRLEKLAERYGAEIVPVPFELRPEIPLDGVSAAEHGLGHGERVETYLQNLSRREGFPLTIVDHVPHTHLAHVMGEVARDAGTDVLGTTQALVFEAYFGRGLDIGSREVLLEIAEAAGLEPEAVERAWRDGTYEDRLAEFKRFAHEIGVTATPSALVCDELLIGTHPYRELAEAAERCLQRVTAH